MSCGNPDTSSQNDWTRMSFLFHNMWSPGLLTHDRTVLHVCSALPLSSKSSSTQEYYSDIMETHLCVYFNVFLNNTTKQGGILSCLTETPKESVIFKEWHKHLCCFFSNVLIWGMEKQKYISACCLFLTKCNHLHLNSETSWNSLLAASEAVWCYALFCSRKIKIENNGGWGGCQNLQNQCEDDLKCSEYDNSEQQIKADH